MSPRICLVQVFKICIFYYNTGLSHGKITRDLYTETWILVQVEKGQVRIVSIFSDTEAYFSFTLRPCP